MIFDPLELGDLASNPGDSCSPCSLCGVYYTCKAKWEAHMETEPGQDGLITVPASSYL